MSDYLTHLQRATDQAAECLVSLRETYRALPGMRDIDYTALLHSLKAAEEFHARLTKLCASVQDSRREDKGQ